MRAGFGQEAEERTLSSPNESWIRTGSRRKALPLSEREPDSDRKPRKSPYPVRKSAGFVQEAEEKPITCPKESRIRTGSRGKVHIQSERVPDSDRKSRKSPDPVRMRAGSGQEAEEKPRSCPNECRIRTEH
ncbi:hypothetical protein [Cytobacillus sp.]|uniref:hypothetical protein n=1 Tax=Cytobacillus sp. TaxID=2675269 RepID=UPI003516AA30